MRWVLLLSELVSQYRCIKLPKTDDIDRTQKKMMQKSYIDILSMLLLDKYLIQYEQFKSLVLDP